MPAARYRGPPMTLANMRANGVPSVDPFGRQAESGATLDQRTICRDQPRSYIADTGADSAWRRSMLTKARTAVATAIILSAASASAAKDGGPPTIDVQKTCRENVNALRTLFGGDIGQNMTTCLMDEQTARDRLVKDWATYPAIAKTLCVHPNEFLPGYVEWEACLDMTRDVLKLRKESASSRGAGAVKGECPVVKYTDDGSIEYVINCPGVGLK
jgi:hypothetical protein